MAKDSLILNEAPEVTITVAQARDGTAEEILDLLTDALDEAQAPVFTEDQAFNYLVIKIVR